MGHEPPVGCNSIFSGLHGGATRKPQGMWGHNAASMANKVGCGSRKIEKHWSNQPDQLKSRNSGHKVTCSIFTSIYHYLGQRWPPNRSTIQHRTSNKGHKGWALWVHCLFTFEPYWVKPRMHLIQLPVFQMTHQMLLRACKTTRHLYPVATALLLAFRDMLPLKTRGSI